MIATIKCGLGSWRLLVSLALAAVALALGPAATMAQTYPSKNVTFISNFGSADTFLRLLLDKIKESGASFIIDSRQGAGGLLALIATKRGHPDGYTLAFTYSSPVNLGAFMAADVDLDPVKDLAPVTKLVEIGIAINVLADYPANSLKDLIERAKAKPNSVSISYNSAQAQSFILMMQDISGAKFLAVPYKGAADGTALFLGRHVDVKLDSIGATLALKGKIKSIAFGGRSSSPLLPGVQPIRDTLPGTDYVVWLGVMAPAGTPPDVISWLHNELTRALKDPQVAGFARTSGYDVVGNTPSEFRASLISEIEANKNVIRKYSAFLSKQ